MKKEILFVRYGGLSPMKQDHYVPDSDPDKTFHNPPRKNGLYAMIKGYEDLFLLGATCHPNHISGKFSWLKDDEGNLIKDSNDIRTYSEQRNKNHDYTPEFKRFLKKRGIKENQIWSSKINDAKIDCPDDVECEVCPLKEKCDEIGNMPHYLTVLKKPKSFSYNGEIWHHLGEQLKPHEIIEKCGSWVKTEFDIFVKALDKDRHSTMKDGHKNEWYEKSDFNTRLHNPYKRTFGVTYSKDHLEVFIEKL